MAHFAKLGVDNVVLTVLYLETIHNINPVTGVESEEIGIKYLTETHGHENWRQCSINTSKNQHREDRTPLRGHFPQPGYVYDSSRDAFIPPESLKPYPSWIWDEDTLWWKSPIEKPSLTSDEISEGWWWKWDEENMCYVKTLRAV